MKYPFLLFFFLTFKLYAQKVEVLLIGVSHNYSKSAKQDISAIESKIRKFKPTAFFGEFLSKEDEQHLMDYWCKEENIKKVNDINAFERKCFDSKGIKNSLETNRSSPEILPEGLF